MSEIVRDYYQRFKSLDQTVRLLLVVCALGICSLYVLGLVSLIAAPRLRQAQVAYAETILPPSAPTETAELEPSATPTEIATATPTATPPPPESAAPSLAETPAVPTVEATPTQRPFAPIAAPPEPRIEPSPTHKGGSTPTATPKSRPTATPFPRRTPRPGH